MMSNESPDVQERDGPAGYDCQQCGACCVSPFEEREGYVELSSADEARVRAVGLPVLTDREGFTQLGTVPFAGMGGERICSAFSGKVGGCCGCSIYPDRPQECRLFEPGSLRCEAARYEAGLGPDPLADLLRRMAELDSDSEADQGEEKEARHER
jgi:Fe-S-cluster containining protein